MARRFRLCALWLAICLSFCLPSGCQTAPKTLDLTLLRQEIHRLTNQVRAEQGQPPLTAVIQLDEVARRHSADMAERGFFDHTNPDGLTPAQRLLRFLPGLLAAASGENIAVRSLAGESETEMAGILIQMWKDSQGHYRNMISPVYWHLGIGVVRDEDKLYATQTFAAGIALLESALPERVASGEPVTLRFRFLSGFPKSELGAFMHAPDPTARIPTGSGGNYLGKGPLTLNWLDETHFELKVGTSYGLGTCRVALGRKGAYYDPPYRFEVVSPTLLNHKP